MGSVLNELVQSDLNMFGTNLEELQLIKCSLTDKEANKLTKAMPRLQNVLEVDLSHNEFKNSFAQILKAIGEHCYNIHSLSLSSCSFKEGQNNMQFTLAKCPGLQPFMFLKRLDLSSSLRDD